MKNQHFFPTGLVFTLSLAVCLVSSTCCWLKLVSHMILFWKWKRLMRTFLVRSISPMCLHTCHEVINWFIQNYCDLIRLILLWLFRKLIWSVTRSCKLRYTIKVRVIPLTDTIIFQTRLKSHPLFS